MNYIIVIECSKNIGIVYVMQRNAKPIINITVIIIVNMVIRLFCVKANYLLQKKKRKKVIPMFIYYFC
jgi:hypothetical protein